MRDLFVSCSVNLVLCTEKMREYCARKNDLGEAAMKEELRAKGIEWCIDQLCKSK